MTAQPTSLVIFGITGDLANRKLLPSLYNLDKYQLLPDAFHVIGTTRRELTLDAVFEKLQTTLGENYDEVVFARLKARFEIVTMDMTRDEDYAHLREKLDDAEDAAGICMTRLFYLAVPAQHFIEVVNKLGNSGLQQGCRHDDQMPSRLLIEKPFGYDVASSEQLIQALEQHFTEDQLYRVDHYLAKETAQNLLTFRFRNPLFKSAWNTESIKSVMITAAESIGIEGRADFYEQTGALRDLIQSHLLQLLALVAMDEPESFTSEAIHKQKLALLQAIEPIASENVDEQAVRGQYVGYRSEVENADSFVETYAALRLTINNQRWQGVPILLRTGKAMITKVIEITVVFSDESEHTNDNALTIRLQPNEGVVLQMLVKKPGLTDDTEPVQMEFCYDRSFAANGQDTRPDAYERVLLDATRGDKTLFATGDEVRASWRIIENVIQKWQQDGQGLQLYEKESWGPDAADQLASAAHVDWLTDAMNICPVNVALPNHTPEEA